MLTAERAHELLTYDAETGILFWKPRPVLTREDKIFNSRFAGKPAGTKDACPYVRLSIDGCVHCAHSVVWLMAHGTYQKGIDHKDLDQTNNRLENLRPCNQSLNMANQPAPKHNTSGIKGVYRHSRGDKWVANIKVKQKCIYLGVFDSIDDAAAAYRDAAIRHFGEFARSE